MGGATLEVTSNCFIWGMFQHKPLLQPLLLRDLHYEEASLQGFVAVIAADGSMPFTIAQAGAVLHGKILRGLSESDLGVLRFVQDCVGHEPHQFTVELATGEMVAATVFLPKVIDPEQAVLPWNFDDWVMRFGEEYALTAKLYMQEFLRRPAIAARIPQMLARAGSALRAGQVAPSEIRHHAAAGDVVVAEKREPYARFFAVEEIDVSYRRFDGSMSQQVTRAGFVSCDAVTVLPYDPVRDRVLLVEQFRSGPFLRGDTQPWQLEAIAGRIDSGETPEAAARREAREEAGLELGELTPVAQYYPSPGIITEYLYSYVALMDLPDGVTGVFGLEGEAEDIRGHLVSFERLMQLAASGELATGPTLLTAYWLAGNRDRLRGA
jgi:ADP-ribose pyrophosphatase